MEMGGSWETTVTPDLEVFLSDLDMFYLGAANAEGQPYIQYRFGSPGILNVMDEKTLGFADFGGNRQYITLGNLSENPLAFIFPDGLRPQPTHQALGQRPCGRRQSGLARPAA